MTNNLIGRFYFKLTNSKNLIGEFSNNFSTKNYTESADRIILDDDKHDKGENAKDDKFVGEYFTTWHEEIGGKHGCVLERLKITRKHDGIFSLTWEPVSKDGIPFWGEGLLCDGILIGDYRNFDQIQ